jgi:hypothetical protein
LSELFSYHTLLAEEVIEMLTESPAGSWQTFDSSRAHELGEDAPGEDTANAAGFSNAAFDSSDDASETGGRSRKRPARLDIAWDMTEKWDPELGLGPEEIVAVCVLAAFISEREEAAAMARVAFKWVKGWVQVSLPPEPRPRMRADSDLCQYLDQPQATFAETTNIVTSLRIPTRPEKARVWLLAYVRSRGYTL